MTTLKYHITSELTQLPYYNTPQQISEQDGLEYRIVYDNRVTRHETGGYHLEHRRLFNMRTDTDLDSWRLAIDNLEDHISSCHFIADINRTFNTEFVCSDAEWECTDQTMPCEPMETDGVAKPR